MGLSASLGIAIAGLNVTQAGLNLTAENIANANTAGYTKKSLSASQQVAGDRLIGIRSDQIQRAMDDAVQTQLRQYSSDMHYTNTLAGYAERVDFLFGEPGAATALDSQYNEFLQALESLASTPESSATRYAVLAAADTLASQLNLISDQVQSMRSEVDGLIEAQATEANEILAQIETLEGQIMAASTGDTSPVGLLDLRDGLVNRLSELLDVKVQSTGQNSGIRILTDAGVTLFAGTAASLAFEATGTINATSAWSADSTESDLGSLTFGSVAGTSVDLFQSNILRSGSIAGLRDLRDDLLVQVQDQLDELASQMALALSVSSEDGQPVASPPVNYAGFDVDLNGLLQGNHVALTFDQSGTSNTVRFVRVDDPALLPLANDATGDPNDIVFGIDFSGGLAGAFGDMQTALDTQFGAGTFTLSDKGSETLRVLDDGLAGTISITSLAATKSASGLQSGSVQLPFFTDSVGTTSLYTGSFEGTSQKTGFAGRIQVNEALQADSNLLTNYTGTTPAGDVSRPNAILEALSESGVVFSTSDGGAPFTGSINTFITSMISQQGAASEQLTRNLESQETAFNQLKSRFDDTTKVDIDTELARLIELQTAYSANARIMTAVKEMMDALLRI
jgi:flagellar hook-associated protein 1 FlgK